MMSLGSLSWLTWLALPLAMGAILIGAFATVEPRLASRQFGIPSDSPYVRAVGVRDIFLGLAILLTFLHGHFILLGELCVAIAPIACVDSYVNWRAGSRRFAALHLAGAVASLAYGIALIFTN